MSSLLLCELAPPPTVPPAPRAVAVARESVTDLIIDETAHLRAVARRLTKCDADADDLVQGTLMRAYVAQDRFEPGTSVRAWTTTILRRLHLTAALSAKRRRVVTDTDAGGPIDRTAGGARRHHGGPSTGLGGIAELLDDDVKCALERVPEIYRGAFILAVVHGMSCSEIAVRLCVHESTAMSRIHRARERLRAALAHRRRGPRASALAVPAASHMA